MDKALTGAAGEYYIAFRLSALGYAIGLTTRGTRAADLLASNPETGKSIIVQTKTMINAFVKNQKSGSYWHWRIGSSRPQPRETFYYMFVDLRGDPSKSPDVFVVPSLKIKPLLVEYTNYTGCAIYERDKKTKKAYLNRWDIIEKALGTNPT
jgi:hypothetical protein